MANRSQPVSSHPTTHSFYGWIPDLPDQRDFSFNAAQEHLSTLPTKIDLRPLCPKIYDQGALGSCTANAIAAAIEFDLLKQHLPDFIPSRLFIYYNERVMEHSVASDSGAQIRDGIKTIAKQGVCPETLWPYDITKFAFKPPAAAYTEAANYKAVSYQRILRSLSQMKGCLAAGFPFAFGFSVYSAFESKEVASSGILNLPTPQEDLLGGHAVLAVGYDDAHQRFIVRNSWGAKWGQKGTFTIPYAYLLSSALSSDFWTVRVMQ